MAHSSAGMQSPYQHALRQAAMAAAAEDAARASAAPAVHACKPAANGERVSKQQRPSRHRWCSCCWAPAADEQASTSSCCWAPAADEQASTPQPPPGRGSAAAAHKRPESLLVHILTRTPHSSSDGGARAAAASSPGAASQGGQLYSETEWMTALSHATPSFDLAQRLAELESHGGPGPASSRPLTSAGGVLPPWVPSPPLLFAEPGLQHFVPVPAVTGFSGVFEIDPARTTPFPQPIDIMVRASFLTKKVHASIRYMHFQESETQLLLSTQPSLVPAGLPSVYTEKYDKQLGSSTERPMPSWAPRRDLQLGSCYGRVYFTAQGMLVLRCEARAPFSKRVAFVTEDYLMLQDGGDTVVDRMCCKCMTTGRTASQFYVLRRRAA